MAEAAEPEPTLHEVAAPETAQRDIVVVGASAGGVEALRMVASGLPDEFPAAVFVVLHMLPTANSVLPAILDRAGPLPSRAAEDGEPIERGRIYVAPPDRHLLVTADRVRLTNGPRENGHRPAVDPLFRSAARAFRERVIAVVLSGALDDGTAGLRFVKRRGGTTMAQDPDDALYPGMPASAVANDGADHVVPLVEIAPLLYRLVDTPTEIARTPEADLGDAVPAEPDRSDDDPTYGNVTPLTCPECGGSLWEHLDPDGYVRFKCHVGHAYSPDSLETAQSEGLEMALWSALRTLEERGDLFRRLARRAGLSARPRFEAKVKEVGHHADLLRQSIERLGRVPSAEDATPVVEAEGG